MKRPLKLICEKVQKTICIKQVVKSSAPIFFFVEIIVVLLLCYPLEIQKQSFKASDFLIEKKRSMPNYYTRLKIISNSSK